MTVVFVVFIIPMHVVNTLISIDFTFIMANHYSKRRNFLDCDSDVSQDKYIRTCSAFYTFSLYEIYLQINDVSETLHKKNKGVEFN